MTGRKFFELDILCPNCGASGDARVSQNDDADVPDPGFRVDQYPQGFSEKKPSADCGQEFYLL